MLLDSAQVESNLRKLPLGWVVTGNSLEKVFKFDDYSQGVGFIVKVGELADRINHHPEVKLGWGKVEVSLTTHEQSGLTQKDFALAKEIEQI